MEEVGLPHILSEEGKAAGIDRYLVCSGRDQGGAGWESINRFIAEKCAKYPAFIGLGAWHQDVADIEGELDRIQALGPARHQAAPPISSASTSTTTG